MFQEDENSGGKTERKKLVSLKLGSKLLHSLDFSYFMLCSIIEDILQHKQIKFSICEVP